MIWSLAPWFGHWLCDLVAGSLEWLLAPWFVCWLLDLFAGRLFVCLVASSVIGHFVPWPLPWFGYNGHLKVTIFIKWQFLVRVIKFTAQKRYKLKSTYSHPWGGFWLYSAVLAIRIESTFTQMSVCPQKRQIIHQLLCKPANTFLRSICVFCTSKAFDWYAAMHILMTTCKFYRN